MNFLHILSKSRFRLDVAWLAGGTALSQAIQAIATPVLSRLYTPSAFGDLALLLSVAGIAVSFAGLRYELGIVPAESDEEAAGVLTVQGYCNILVALLLLIATAFFGRNIAGFLGMPQLARWLYLTPLIVFLAGAGNAATFWLIRTRQFRRLSMFRASQSLVCAGTQTGAGFVGGSPSGLIVGSVLGQVVLASALTSEIRRGLLRSLWPGRSIKSLLTIARKHQNFPRYIIPYSLAGTVRDRGLMIILGVFSTTHEVGLYSFALRLVYIPMGLISGSFSSVIYQRVADPATRADAAPLIYKVISNFTNFGVPAFVILAWSAKSLFALVFGSAWQQAGVYAALWAPPAFMFFISYLFERMFDIVGKQRIAMTIELAYTVLALPIFGIVLTTSQNVTLAIAVLSGVSVVYHAVWIVAVYRVFRFPTADLVRVGLHGVALACVTSGVLWLITLEFHRFMES